MSVLMTSVPVAQVRKWGGACASGALSFAAARVARIVLQREPMASEALSWTTLYSCQGEAVRGRAELALHLLARPELAELDDRTVHEPWRNPEAASGYPEPLVGLQESRERALETYQRLKDG